MSELERLARAAQGAMLTDDSCLSPDICRHPPCPCSKDIARAILRELREPTGGMIGAGNAAGCKSTWRTVTTDVWQAMLDHILSEGSDE